MCPPADRCQFRAGEVSTLPGMPPWHGSARDRTGALPIRSISLIFDSAITQSRTSAN